METINYIIDYFNNFYGMLELFGSISSLICVYLAAKHNIWTWFWGTIGVICFGVLFYEYRLYSDTILQLVYFLPMQYFGYKLWQEVRNWDQTHVVLLKASTFKLHLFLIVVLAASTGYFMHNVLEANKSYPDALLAWLSVFGQFYLNRQYLQSWFLWIAVDVIGIWVYFTSELYITATLYVIFLIMACFGAIRWTSIYIRKQSNV